MKAILISTTLCLLVPLGAQDKPAPDLDRILKETAAHQPGKEREYLSLLEARVRAVLTDPAKKKALTLRLAKLLGEERTTDAGKAFLCRQLARAGEAECVPHLAPLLADPELSHMARYALQRIPGPAATKALLHALATVTGKLRIGMVTSLGERDDPLAVPALAGLLGGGDENLARASAGSLGKIGGPTALGALARAANQHSRCYLAAQRARILIAEKMGAAGKITAARALLAELFHFDQPGTIRLGALTARLRLADQKELPAILDLIATGDSRIAGCCLLFLRNGLPGPDTTLDLACLFPRLGEDRAVQALGVIADRGDPEVRPPVLCLAKESTPPIRRAALLALGRIGTAADLPLLVAAVQEKEPIGGAAKKALEQLAAPGVDQFLIKALATTPPKGQRILMDIMGNRFSPGAMTALCELARTKENRVRQAAYRTMGKVARKEDLPRIIALVIGAPEGHQKSARKALAAACRLTGDEKSRLDPLLAAMEGATIPARCTLLAVLPLIGGEAALKPVKKALTASDPKILEAAIRALCAWENDKPLAAILTLAKEAAAPKHRILALRAAARILGKRHRKHRDDTVKQFLAALDLAKRPEEQRLMVSGLGKQKCLTAILALEKLRERKDIQKEVKAAINQLGKDAKKWVPKKEWPRIEKILSAVKKTI